MALNPFILFSGYCQIASKLNLTDAHSTNLIHILKMTTSVSGARLDIGFQGNRDLLHMQMDYHDGPFQAMHRFSRV